MSDLSIHEFTFFGGKCDTHLAVYPKYMPLIIILSFKIYITDDYCDNYAIQKITGIPTGFVSIIQHIKKKLQSKIKVFIQIHLVKRYLNWFLMQYCSFRLAWYSDTLHLGLIKKFSKIFGLVSVSLFNSLSNFVDYFIQNPSL